MKELLYEEWYHIPGFNGYIINGYGDVRSLKFYNACPEGIYIKYHGGKRNDGYYELSDNKNVRVKKSKKELLNLVKNSENTYIQPEGTIYMGSRNKGYMNYDKKYPNNKGIVKIDIINNTTEIIEKSSNNSIDNIGLSFSSFNQFKKKEPEPMVRFY